MYDHLLILFGLYMTVVAFFHVHALSNMEDAEKQIDWKEHVLTWFFAIIWPISLVIYLIIHEEDK